MEATTMEATTMEATATATSASPRGIACCRQDHKKSDQDDGEKQHTLFHGNSFCVTSCVNIYLI
jgi:hypothetical protein